MNPVKYALSLMDALFSDDELGSKCFSCGKRATKPQLSLEKIKLIEGKHSYVHSTTIIHSYIGTCRVYRQKVW